MYQTGNTMFGCISKHCEEKWKYVIHGDIVEYTVGVLDISTLSKLKLRREPENNY